MNLDSALNDKNTDIFSGVFGGAKMSDIKVSLGYFDSWLTNNIFYGLRANGAASNSNAGAVIGIGADLALISIEGKKLANSALDFNATLARVQGIFDYMAFASLKYDFGAFHILAQGAATGFKDEPNFRAGGVDSEKLAKWATSGRSNETRPNYGGFSGADSENWAKNRGVYNIQAG